MMQKTLRYLLALAAVLVALDVALLLTDTRLLIAEHIVRPGESYEVEGFGDAGAKAQATLVCTYFTGRSVKTMVLWYDSNNMIGRDSCAVLKSGEP